MQNPFFCLHKTKIGIDVVDYYQLADHHNFINHQIPDKEYKMTITSFAGSLASQLICNVSSLLLFYNPVPQELISLGCTATPAEVIFFHQSQESACSLTSGEKSFYPSKHLKMQTRLFTTKLLMKNRRR
jgi:hypothetical protein